MNAHADKSRRNQRNAAAAEGLNRPGDGGGSLQFVDNRHQAVAQRELQAMPDKSSRIRQLQAVQRMVGRSLQGTARFAAAPTLQLVLDDTAQGFVDPELDTLGLGDYETLSPHFSSTKIAAIDLAWAVTNGKKRARKVIIAKSIARKINGYLDTFAAKAGEWDAGTYASATDSMEDHCIRHAGAWEDVEEYTDAALAFKAQEWDNRFSLSQPDRQRMHDAQYFLITTDAGKIVTFGDR